MSMWYENCTSSANCELSQVSRTETNQPTMNTIFKTNIALKKHQRQDYLKNTDIWFLLSL